MSDLIAMQTVKMAFLQTLLSHETPYPWNFLAVETDTFWEKEEEICDFADCLTPSEIEQRMTALFTPFKANTL